MRQRIRNQNFPADLYNSDFNAPLLNTVELARAVARLLSCELQRLGVLMKLAYCAMLKAGGLGSLGLGLCGILYQQNRKT